MDSSNLIIKSESMEDDTETTGYLEYDQDWQRYEFKDVKNENSGTFASQNDGIDTKNPSESPKNPSVAHGDKRSMDSSNLKIRSEPVENNIETTEYVEYGKDWLRYEFKDVKKENSGTSVLQDDVDVDAKNQNESLKKSSVVNGNEENVYSSCLKDVKIKLEPEEDSMLPETVHFDKNWLSYEVKKEEKDDSMDPALQNDTHMDATNMTLEPQKSSAWHGACQNICSDSLPFTSQKENEKKNKTSQDHSQIQGNCEDSKHDTNKSGICDLIEKADKIHPSSILNKEFSKPKKKLHHCDVCGKTFTRADNLREHSKVHTGEKSFCCTICGKAFAHSSTLKYHIMIHTNERPHRCDVCNQAFTRSSFLTKHMRVHTGEKPYQCQECSKGFADPSTLKNHLRTHTNEKPYLCDFCNKAFTTASYLKSHTRIHTNEKPYQCEVCNKTFTQSTSLRSHMRVHTKMKPYQCQVCDKKFSESSSLTKHSRIHTNDKPYRCNVCNNAFATSWSFKNHTRTHTKEKPYHCDVCNKKFSHPTNLARHLIIHTNDKPFHCDICNKAFPLSATLKRHSKIHTKKISGRRDV